MKKNVPVALVILVIACGLFTAGCGEKEKTTHTDPAFLVGRWVRTATDDLPDFSIKDNFSFECVVDMPADAGLSKITGSLDYKGDGLGPNDYMIRDMTTKDDEVGTYTAGNTVLDTQLGGFQNLLATLAPNGDKTEFVFTSANQAAKMFFGGTYTKQAE
jgi:hypothetical protein